MSPRSSAQDAPTSKQKNSKQTTKVELALAQPIAPVKPTDRSDGVLPPEHASPKEPLSKNAKRERSRSVQSASNAHVRTITPMVAKASTRMDAVTNTLASLTAQANRGWTSFVAASASPRMAPSASGSIPNSSAPYAARPDGSISPVYDAFENAGDMSTGGLLNDADVQARLGQGIYADSVVSWSRWDRLPSASYPHHSAPVLITAFRSGIFQLLQMDWDELKEILSIPATSLLDEGSNDGESQVLTACVSPTSRSSEGPDLLLVTKSSGTAALAVVRYSLAKHTVRTRVRLRMATDNLTEHAVQAADIQANDRFVCIAVSPAASIHVLRCDDLEYTVGPIIDAGLNPHSGSTLMSLSGRLLAYGTTQPVGIAEIISDTKGREGSRARSSTYSQSHLNVGDVREHVMETSAHVGDVARRVGGGVLSGMRTLGEWGSSYLSGSPSSPPAAGQAHTSAMGYSQSAPNASPLLRPTSSASSSPLLAPADKSRSKRSSMHGDKDISRQGGQVPVSMAVRIVDLGLSGQTVSVFSPSSHPISMVSLSPNGQLCLTADSLGHAFHIFELQFSGSFGSRAISDAALPILHRYKLHRGVTSAQVLEAQWSQDAQWVAVGTSTGTVHVYPLNPYGGPASALNHVSGKIRNAVSMPPLSQTINSLARTARPIFAEERTKVDHPSRSANNSQETDTADAVTSAAGASQRPSFMLLDGLRTLSDNAGKLLSRSDRQTAEASGVFNMDVLTFDPRGVSVSLHKIGCTAASQRNLETPDEDSATPSTAAESPASASAGRTSGLTQMMRRAGGGLMQGNGLPRLVGECSRTAAWNGLASALGAPAVRVPVAKTQSHDRERSSIRSTNSQSWVAKAEIETYSQAPRILPASIYLSRQCYFQAYERPVALPERADPLLSSIHRSHARRIAVREMATTLDPAGQPHPDDVGFDDRLAGALDELAFDQNDLDAQSPSSRIPSFPQGQRARTSGWRTGSIPIRMVTEGIGGVYRAGRELGRGVDMARRRTSGGNGRSGTPGQSTSLSFDGGEDVDTFFELHGRRPLAVGSATSAASIPSRMGPSSRSGESQPSSAETPMTGFSEVEGDFDDHIKRPSLFTVKRDFEEDALDWDSFADPELSGKDAVGAKQGSGRDGGTDKEVSDFTEDFTFGGFDEEDLTAGHKDVLRSSSPGSEDTASPKGLVYALRGGSTGRSSLRSSIVGSGAATVVDLKTGEREESPAPSVKSDSLSSSSGDGNSGMSEGSKETHTSIPGALLSTVPIAISTHRSSGKKKGGK